MQLIDTHCHPQYIIDDNYNAEQFIADCSMLHSYLMVAIVSADFSLLKDLATLDNRAYYSVGIHPSHVHEENLIDLEKFDYSDPNLIALGESGLDYFHSKEHMKLQKDFFVKHLELSKRTRLPIIIHTRSAAEDTLQILKTDFDSSGVIHCFTESLDFAKRALDCGLYLSFSGIITFKNAEELRDVVRYCPPDRILIETDAPFLTPVPFRGKQNHPKMVEYVAKMIADLKGLDHEAMSLILLKNTLSLFQKMK
jgi:TatD DNase family protein